MNYAVRFGWVCDDFLVVYLLISGKVSPMVIFVAVPFVAALICGFTPAQILNS